MKTCTVCNIEKPKEDFYLCARPTGARYYHSRCKPCTLAKTRQWRELNPERVRATDKAWKQANPERVQKAEQGRVRDPQKRAERWARNRDQYLAKAREWKATNRDRVRVLNATRRARKAGAPQSDFTVAQWRALQVAFDFRCAYCGIKTRKLTQDHVIPLVRGGNHTAANIVPACKPCNSRKSAGPAPTYQPVLMLVEA